MALMPHGFSTHDDVKRCVNLRRVISKENQMGKKLYNSFREESRHQQSEIIDDDFFPDDDDNAENNFWFIMEEANAHARLRKKAGAFRGIRTRSKKTNGNNT